YFNPKIYSSANYLTMNNEVGFGDLDLKIEQVHIDPDLFSRKGAEDFFGEDLPSKFFYFDRGNNNGQPLTELLTRHGKGLQLLGLFEFYGQNTEERERGGIYNAVTNALEKADFSPENLAIDPPILEKVPDLGGICRRIIELPGYPASRTGEGIVLSEEPKLYEYPKTLVIAMSHYSAVMTYDRKPIEEMISLLEQEFQPRGYPRTMLSAVPPEY
ncbi:MAG: hypothetical protein KAT35_03705, partial [Candidatus Aenigmarchaeota archaeon]|nr:hypothetical protein [Candidatus Aenigmarchaeota archaeon]